MGNYKKWSRCVKIGNILKIYFFILLLATNVRAFTLDEHVLPRWIMFLALHFECFKYIFCD